MTYPHTEPGWKVTDTSRAAAESVRHTTAEAYSGILAVLRRHHELTADEIAWEMDCDKHYIRSRCSELKGQGKIEATGERRRNVSGKSADVLRIVS